MRSRCSPMSVPGEVNVREHRRDRAQSDRPNIPRERKTFGPIPASCVSGMRAALEKVNWKEEAERAERSQKLWVRTPL